MNQQLIPLTKLPPPSQLPLNIESLISPQTPGNSFVQDVSKKIDEFAQSVSFDFLKWDFLSTEKFYHVVQVTLLVSSCAGVIGAIGLLASGMPSFSLMMVALSSTTAVGAYLSREIAVHKALEAHADNLQKESERFQVQNNVLGDEVTELKKQNQVRQKQLEEGQNQINQLQQCTEELQKIVKEHRQGKNLLEQTEAVLENARVLTEKQEALVTSLDQSLDKSTTLTETLREKTT